MDEFKSFLLLVNEVNYNKVLKCTSETPCDIIFDQSGGYISDLEIRSILIEH